MELTICPTCGSVVKGATKNCAACGNFVPNFPSPPISATATAIKPLRAEIQAQALALDRILIGHPGYGLKDKSTMDNGTKLPTPSSLPVNGELDHLDKLASPVTANSPSAKPIATVPINLQEPAAQPVAVNLDNDQSAEILSTNAAPSELKEDSAAQFYSLPADDFFATSVSSTQVKAAEADLSLSPAGDIVANPISPEASRDRTDQIFAFDLGEQAKSVSDTTESPPELSDAAPINLEEKVANLGVKREPESKLVQSSPQGLEDEKEEPDSGDEDYVAPPRRSFSGSSKQAESSFRQPLAANLKNDEKVDLADEEAEASPAENKDVYLGTLKVPRKAVIIAGCLLGFLLFLIMAANLLSSLFGAQNGPAAQAIVLSGKWRFAAQCGNARCVGELIIHQHGTQITGDGTDNIGGPFKFAGSVKDNQQIDLAKRSVRGGQLVGDVTALHGEIQTDANPLFISGDFRRDTMQGGKWRGKPVTYTGIWEAEMTQQMVEDTIGSYAPGPEANFTKPVGAASLTETFAKGAVAAIIFVIFVLWLMRTLFGPDGLRARWDKEKYIPSQFRGQNKKDIQELSQPLAPGSLPLGQREEWKFWHSIMPWVPKDLALPPALRKRNPHLLILGGGKKGKSRLMASMITHDIESNDRAVVLIDSDGGLADTVTRWISAHPKNKTLAKRVVMIDPSYPSGTNTYNPLAMPEDGNLQSAASSLVFGMKAIYTEAPNSQNAWSAQTADILANAALLLMVSGKTLTDLSTLLTDNDKRDEWLEAIEKRKKEKVEYQGIVDAWGRYKRVARSEQWLNWIEPILNRVSPTLSDPRVRPILTKQDGGINLSEIITSKKILIVKIPKAQLHDHANLLGSLIVTGIKQAALSIAVKDPTQQRAVALYLDEFDNFIEKETFDAITHETKKFQVGFIGAIKTLQHLPEDFRNQLIINVGTISVFALAKKDGDMLGPQMFRVDGRKKKHETLTNFINPINSSPQFELISDEEKFNIDRILGQAERTFFCYRVGTVAGLFHLKSHPFNDIPDSAIDEKLIAKMHSVKA